MGNVCCEEPTNIGGINISSETQNVYQPSEPLPIGNYVQERYEQLKNQILSVDDSKYKDLKIGKPMEEVTKKFVYTGTWRGNQPDGYGNIVFPNGEYFQGQFKNGKAQGLGRFIFKGSDYFQGEIKDNQANGQGTLQGNTVEYKGLWRHSKPTIGTYKLKHNGTIVIMEDEKSGVIEWTNGNKYEGEIKDLNPHGYGNIHFENQCSYDGHWSNGVFSGFGTFKWPNGRVYKGHYINGKKHGQGQFTYENSKRYEGDWKNGHQNGLGKLFQNDELLYEGFFKDGVPAPNQSSPELQNSNIIPISLGQSR